MTRVALSGRDPHQIPITEVMTTPVLMATRSTSIAEATAVMINHQKRHLPVVEDDGRLIGILSIRHVLERKVDELTSADQRIRRHRIRLVAPTSTRAPFLPSFGRSERCALCPIPSGSKL